MQMQLLQMLSRLTGVDPVLMGQDQSGKGEEFAALLASVMNGTVRADVSGVAGEENASPVSPLTLVTPDGEDTEAGDTARVPLTIGAAMISGAEQVSAEEGPTFEAVMHVKGDDGEDVEVPVLITVVPAVPAEASASPEQVTAVVQPSREEADEAVRLVITIPVSPAGDSSGDADRRIQPEVTGGEEPVFVRPMQADGSGEERSRLSMADMPGKNDTSNKPVENIEGQQTRSRSEIAGKTLVSDTADTGQRESQPLPQVMGDDVSVETERTVASDVPLQKIAHRLKFAADAVSASEKAVETGVTGEDSVERVRVSGGIADMETPENITSDNVPPENKVRVRIEHVDGESGSVRITSAQKSSPEVSSMTLKASNDTGEASAMIRVFESLAADGVPVEAVFTTAGADTEIVPSNADTAGMVARNIKTEAPMADNVESVPTDTTFSEFTMTDNRSAETGVETARLRTVPENVDSAGEPVRIQINGGKRIQPTMSSSKESPTRETEARIREPESPQPARDMSDRPVLLEKASLTAKKTVVTDVKSEGGDVSKSDPVSVVRQSLRADIRDAEQVISSQETVRTISPELASDAESSVNSNVRNDVRNVGTIRTELSAGDEPVPVNAVSNRDMAVDSNTDETVSRIDLRNRERVATPENRIEAEVLRDTGRPRIMPEAKAPQTDADVVTNNKSNISVDFRREENTVSSDTGHVGKNVTVEADKTAEYAGGTRETFIRRIVKPVDKTVSDIPSKTELRSDGNVGDHDVALGENESAMHVKTAKTGEQAILHNADEPQSRNPRPVQSTVKSSEPVAVSKTFKPVVASETYTEADGITDTSVAGESDVSLQTNTKEYTVIAKQQNGVQSPDARVPEGDVPKTDEVGQILRSAVSDEIPADDHALTDTRIPNGDSAEPAGIAVKRGQVNERPIEFAPEGRTRVDIKTGGAVHDDSAGHEQPVEGTVVMSENAASVKEDTVEATASATVEIRTKETKHTRLSPAERAEIRSNAGTDGDVAGAAFDASDTMNHDTGADSQFMWGGNSADGDNGILRQKQVDAADTNGPIFSLGTTETSQTESAGGEINFVTDIPEHAADIENKAMDSIVRHASIMIKNGQSSAVIKLDPPSLGKLKLEIVTERSKVSGTITVETHEARQIVENRISELKMALDQHGLKVESFDVQVGHNDGTDAWANRENAERQMREGANVSRNGLRNVTGDVPEIKTRRIPYRPSNDGGLDIWI